MAPNSSTPAAPVSAEAQAQPVALITGAAGGIGRAAAVQFAERGCRVVVVDVDESGAQDTCKAVEAVGGTGFHMACDVSDEEEVQNLMDIVRGHWGRLDYALHTASIRGPTAPLHEYPTADFDSVLSTNVRGYFLCLKYEIPMMLSTGTNPCVVLVSSTEGHTAVPGMVGYVASKWAIRGLALTAAADYGPKGLRVNCVSPGTVGPTLPVAGSATTTTTLESPVQNPDEVAAYVVWVCRHGRGITGADLVMDTAGLLSGGAAGSDSNRGA